MNKPKLGPESENSEPFDFFEFNGIPRPSDLKDTKFKNSPPKRDPKLRKFMAYLFVSLVVFGVAFGSIVSFGLAKLMDKAGLLDVPQKQQEVEQVK